MQAVVPFYVFCESVLRLKLTTGQRVICKVAFGEYDPEDLEGDERDIALQLFGGLQNVPAKAKRFVCMRLGRGSGKTTLCSAYAVYVAVCQPFKVGPGDTMTVTQTLETMRGARTMALDPGTHKIYTAAQELQPAPAGGGRAQGVPDSLRVLVYAPAK